MSILPLQVTSNVQTSLRTFLQTDEWTEPHSFVCNFCQSYQPASIDHEISKVGSYLVLQLKRFLRHHGKFIKDIKKVQRSFFSNLGFLSRTFMTHGTAEEEEGYLFDSYHFNPLHRHLDISWVITAESSPLHIASSWTQTGNLWFPSASR